MLVVLHVEVDAVVDPAIPQEIKLPFSVGASVGACVFMALGVMLLMVSPCAVVLSVVAGVGRHCAALLAFPI